MGVLWLGVSIRCPLVIGVAEIENLRDVLTYKVDFSKLRDGPYNKGYQE